MIRYKRLFLMLSAFSIIGCTQSGKDDIKPVADYNVTFKAIADSKTRTHLESENEVYGEIFWDEGDSLSLFSSSVKTDGGLKFTALSSGAQTDISYSSDQPVNADEFFGLYPFQQSASFDGVSVIKASIPSDQISVDGGFDPSAMLTAGRSADLTTTEGTVSGKMAFYNLCGGFRFSVSQSGITKVVFSSNASEQIAGDICVSFEGQSAEPTVSADNAGTSSDLIVLTSQASLEEDTYYYICMMPQILSQGFSIAFYQGGSSSPFTVSTYTSSIEIERGSFWTVDGADNPSLFGSDLSLDGGPANCYIISDAGSYKFPIVKGNSDEVPYQTVDCAQVLWETVNTASAPSEGTLISEVSTDGEYVYFSTADNLVDGNALIAVKDSSGDVIWSWHIWLCSGYDPDATAMTPVGKSISFMDRNLGALSADPSGDLCNGLMYQWGRKDPFMGAVNRFDGNNTLMASTGSENFVQFDDELYGEYLGSLDYALAHPTTYITGNIDWLYYDRDNSLWGSSKTIYDPCPAGWQIPDGEYDGVWYVADSDIYADDSYLGGFVKSSSGRIFFPACGYRGYTTGKLSGANTIGYIWTYTTDSQFASSSYMSFAFGRKVFNKPSSGWARTYGFSVRCIKK